ASKGLYNDLSKGDVSTDSQSFKEFETMIEGETGKSLNEILGDTVYNDVRLRSRFLQLAYVAAAINGQTGRTLSDKDVANFLEQVGYESNVPEDVGTRTAEFIATAIRKYDRNNPLFSNLNQLSKSTDAGDVTRLNEELASLFDVDRKRLASLQAKDQDGNFIIGEDEADQIRADIRNAINSSSGNKANSFFIFDPKSRRFIYRSYQDIFKRSADNNIDPIAVEFLKSGGYFDTFDIDKNTFLYKYKGQSPGGPQGGEAGPASGARDLGL
ncbi:MAG TPA: hypothetical protein DF712_19865, partial [Balneola sp.]|nr:hypothetical protein [Balneola sp.]